MSARIRSPFDMTPAELERNVIARIIQPSRRELRRLARRHWVGSEETDRIIGSDQPTHRKGVPCPF